MLVAEDGTPIGSAPRASVHTESTPLHLAFSCHVVGEDGAMLMTRRALGKVAWPGVWTNACCGHPRPGEATADAVRRRVREELGAEITALELALPDFSYRAVDASGIVEHEVCPVYIARMQGAPRPDPDEVVEWRWERPERVGEAVRAAPWAFSPWLALQAERLALLGGSA